MTAGFRSTELWVSLAGFALGAFLVFSGHSLEGAGLSAVSIWTYGHARAKVKAPRPYLPPVGKL